MNQLGIFMNLWENNWDADHTYYIRKAARLGFDILEFQAQSLLDMSDERLREIKACADDNGITLTYSLGLDPRYDISSPDTSLQAAGVKYLSDIMRQMQKIDGRIISGVSYAGWGIPDGPINKEQRRDISVGNMQKLADVAADLGITYCVEAINRFEGLLINTAQEALDYVDRVDRSNVGILLDTYHMNIEEASLGDAIRLVGDRLTAFHMGENNRTCPGCGKGHIPWDEVFEALHDIHFRGQIVSEPFVMQGGEVGRSIFVWRDLLPNPTEEALDREAAQMLQFERDMLKKWNVGA